MNLFRDFVEAKYEAELLENLRRGKKWLVIDHGKLARFDPELAEDAISDPEESLKAAELACESVQHEERVEVRVRFKNLPKSCRVKIRDVRSEHVGKLMVVEGVLRSRSDVRPQVTSARFECPSCGNVFDVLQFDQKFSEPTRCACGRKGKFRLISKELIDVQSLTLEEDISEIGDDTNTKKLKVLLKADLTRPELDQDLVPPASLRVVGIIKESPIIMRSGSQSTKFDLFLEANSFEPIEDNLRRISFKKDDIEKFRDFSKNPCLIEDLRRSVAPHLWGMDKIKEAVLLFIVKGVKKESTDKTLKARDFFHILLIGDPGSGKSEFGKEVKKLSYKCKRAVGKGASGVGLTVSAERDELLNERVLTAGTIPTCNGGHCVVDEVDKLDDEVQSHMLDCMEEGSITITKSRVNGTIKSEVGIFMIANPKHGRFVLETPLTKQINLMVPLISRFDLIIPLIDDQDEEKDARLVDAIFNKHSDICKVSQRPVDYEFLRKYLCYVSMNVKPKLSEESLDVIRRFVLDLRKNGKASGVVSITPRQIEGPIRLTEAYAKLRMADVTNRDDAVSAVNIIKYSLKKFGYDEKSGVIDIDRLESGVGSAARSAISLVGEAMGALLPEFGKTVPVDQIIIWCGDKGLSEAKVAEAIIVMREKGDLFEPKHGFVAKM